MTDIKVSFAVFVMRYMMTPGAGLALWLILQTASAFGASDYILAYSSPLSLEKRSTGLTCNTEVVDNLAQSAKETCSQVGAVDKYIENVHSKDLLPVPSFDDSHGFKSILSQYNVDLRKAKSHCHPWRNGDNIVGFLKAVVLSAQGFEPKIKEDLVKIEASIKNLLENHEDIATVEAEIAKLQKEIDEAKEAAEFTNATAVLTHLESVIKEKEEAINTTMTEHEVSQGRRELAELIKYLEFVRGGAIAVENDAVNVSSKLSSFSGNITGDAGAFKRHSRVAQEGIARLEEERQSNNNELESNRKGIADLRKKIADENSQIASLNAQIAQAQREIRESQDRINRNIGKTKKRRKFGSWFRFVPVVGWTIGNKFYRDAKRREEQLINERRNTIADGNRQIANLRNHIATRTQDIKNHETRITSLESKSRQLEEELQHFKELNGHLQSLESDVNAILPTIENAVNSIGKLKETFDSIKQSLSSTIERAKEAKTAAEVKDMRYFIYNEIDDLKCKWEGAQGKIFLVGKCV